MTETVTSDQIDTLVTALDLVRSGRATNRPEIVRTSGLGRNVVTQRVSQLLDAGLLVEGQLSASTGGRAARGLQFVATAGYLLVAELGASRLRLAVADLAGSLHATRTERIDVADGPEPVLGRVVALFDDMLTELDGPAVWGVGVALPGPVEFASGRAVSPPIMPGWDGFPVRDHFASRYDVPVWVDNDVNVMALGEHRRGLARGESDVVFVKVGSGIGAGLIAGGRLLRGAQGCAGDIGHIGIKPHSKVVCRCGRRGCLEALAGGVAVARDAAAAAAAGGSPYLSGILGQGRSVDIADVAAAAAHGDHASVDLLTASGHLVGEALAGIVNFFNPSLIVIGGGVTDAGDLYLAAIRERVLARSLPLATRELRIARSTLADRAGLIGAAYLVADELLSTDRLGQWIGHGTPASRPDLVVA